MVELTFLIKLFGVINILFIPLSFYVCWNKGGQFSFLEHPISYASKTKIKLFYSTSLVLIALFQVLFISGLFYMFPSTQTALALSLFYSGMVSLALSGIVTSSISKPLHRFFTLYMMFSIIIWAYVFSSYFFRISTQVGYGGVVIALVASFGVPLLYVKTKAFGLSELLFVLLTMTWNSLFLYSLGAFG